MRPTPGNHEYFTPGAAGYFDYFAGLGIETGGAGDGYYAFDLGDWTFLSLNSNCSSVPCEAGSEQERWLREQLAEAHLAERCTLAFWHHPRASSGSHGSQSRVADLWATFVEQGGDLVLAGHDHHYERFGPLDAEANPTDDGPISWVVGTGGKSLRSASPPIAGSARVIDDAYGLIRMELGPDSFEWEWVGLGDEGADSGAGTCRS
jgi:3',5'-cyclic AMP phosphodiesterase CpdA